MDLQASDSRARPAGTIFAGEFGVAASKFMEADELCGDVFCFVGEARGEVLRFLGDVDVRFFFLFDLVGEGAKVYWSFEFTFGGYQQS